MSAAGFLKRVAQVLEDRGAAYGDPKTQMEAIARRWSITLGTPVTAQQVALCMIDLKLARLAHDPSYADGPVDVIGYASATADSFTIEITVRTDQLLDTAKVLTELELI